jgi:hypothetical protein
VSDLAILRKPIYSLTKAPLMAAMTSSHSPSDWPLGAVWPNLVTTW